PLALPNYLQHLHSITHLKNTHFPKSLHSPIQPTHPPNPLIQQTKHQLHTHNFHKYTFKQTSHQHQFNKIQSPFKQQQPILFTPIQPTSFSKQLHLKIFKHPHNIYPNNNQHIHLLFNKHFKQPHPPPYTLPTPIPDHSTKS
ncbi:glycine betaine ABC transporter substrate-binding protein, partial [Staphylococcus epidermidis]|uniref:glycine betaine ABC transporter substrate-binding protein n=1 Tax=Staphylococcus epidermidis TaxID=1282 RepID=UPI0037DA17C0